MKTLRIAVLTAITVAVGAAPAGAAPVLADDQYKWFYWVAPILALSAIGMILLLGGEYIRRVLVPKFFGRKQQ